jgi:MFS family permease
VAGVFRTLLRSRALWRVELAFALFIAAEYAVWVAMLVYAYDRGGTTAAGLVAVAQLVPGAIFAPFAGALSDRHPAGRVLALGYGCQAIGMGLTAAVIAAGAPDLLVYASAAAAQTCITFTRPAQGALIPAIARTPDELTAANVVSVWVEGAMVLAGPFVAGLILEISGVDVVFAVFAVSAVASLLLVRPVPGPRPLVTGEPARFSQDALAGFRVLREEAESRDLVLLIFAEELMLGCADLLYVLVALDLLALGNSWAGYLNAAFGAGGVIGASLAAMLVGRRRLVPPLLWSAVVWGAAFAALGVVGSAAAAAAVFLVAGGGRSLFDVSARTLLQRTAPPEALARIFGVAESMSQAGLALGSLLVPLLALIGGPTAAVVGAGIVMPAIIFARLRALRAIDAAATVPVVELALLRQVPMFESLPAPELEGLAHNMHLLEVPAGTAVVEEGDHGDRFYVVASGAFTVTAGGRTVNRLEAGDGFGEIALLRDVPRTATVRADEDARVYALAKDAFLIALTGHAPTRQRAEATIDHHLAS